MGAIEVPADNRGGVQTQRSSWSIFGFPRRENARFCSFTPGVDLPRRCEGQPDLGLLAAKSQRDYPAADEALAGKTC